MTRYGKQGNEALQIVENSAPGDYSFGSSDEVVDGDDWNLKSLMHAVLSEIVEEFQEAEVKSKKAQAVEDEASDLLHEVGICL